MARTKTNLTKRKRPRASRGGKLRIGDHWNAINIIALSQTNPLKAVAEFVENCIDAQARHITIVRGRQKGRHYLRVVDDGSGIPQDEDGIPDFKFVATHICDSIKRQLKDREGEGIQGEFGIGLLSFWTVGEELQLTSAGADGTAYRMTMTKGSPDYRVTARKQLFSQEGTELVVYPLLAGVRQLSGERIQRYLSAELRDRIRRSSVEIRVIDRAARSEYRVEPRQFSGQLLHNLPTPQCDRGEIYVELYLSDPGPDNRVGLYRRGTRVLPSISELERFQCEPWSSGYLQGIIDASFLTLSPGTRRGIIQDDAYSYFSQCMLEVEKALQEVIEEHRRAEEEEASQRILRSVRRALREAFLALPREDYDWFDLYSSSRRAPEDSSETEALTGVEEGASGDSYRRDQELDEADTSPQREFFEFPGPLHSVVLSPRSAVVKVGESKSIRALCRDRSGRIVDESLHFSWCITEGEGRIEHAEGEFATFHASDTPGLTLIEVKVVQRDTRMTAGAALTVTDSLIDKHDGLRGPKKGLPGYTFRHAPGELWRSRMDFEQNLVIINNGHRDFVFASRQKNLKLRYICRLFGKELVLQNFPGIDRGKLLERMIELSLYTEEYLR